MRTGESVLFFGGRVHQGAGAEPARWAHVEAGRVCAVGGGSPPDLPGAARFDLGGRALVPAFCDAHAHLTWIATSFLGCDLASCRSVRQVLETLAGWRGPGRGTEGDWIVGYGFDETAWDDARLPTRAEIDRVEAGRPVLLQRVCGHVGVVNSPALARAAPGPYTNRESGRLAEDDLYAVNDLLRPETDLLESVLPRVAATLHAHGITAVHDVTSPEMLRALQRAERSGRLDLRVSCSIPARYLRPPAERVPTGAADPTAGPPARRGIDPADFFSEHGLDDVPAARGDGMLRLLGVKLFLDGSLGARTAFLRAPYADAPATRGLPLYEPGDLAALVLRVDAAGLQLMTHAIGDAAIDLGLDALEPVLVDGNQRRHRLEHVEVTPPDLVARLARSGVRACVQPNFAGRWSQPGGMNEQRLGARLGHCNIYRTLSEAGVRLAFGSDCMPLGPLYGLRSAVAHPLAGERLDPELALDLYTVAGADLVRAEGLFGRIAPGLLADLVVLDPDPIAHPDEFGVRVDASFLAGRLVYGAVG